METSDHLQYAGDDSEGGECSCIIPAFIQPSLQKKHSTLHLPIMKQERCSLDHVQ